jgi:C4-dicarboxylate-specific signal transduction histidine kinase
MKIKNTIFGIFLVSAVVLSFVFSEIKQQFETIENEKYTIVSQSLKERVKNLISDKQSSTLAIALTLSQNSNIVEAVKAETFNDLVFKKISEDLKKLTDYKNVWIQFIDTKGTSLYRSWTDQKGDNLYDIRADLRELIATKQLKSSISVGIFSMTFKSMVPIFDNNKFVGVIEIITHFNSISKKLELDKLDSIVLADKKFEKQLTHNVTKQFIDGYYLANLENKPNYVTLLKQIGIENLLNMSDYNIVNDVLITYEKIKGVDGETLGYFVLFKKIADIEKADIQAFKFILILFIIVLILSLLIFLFLLRSHEKSNIIKINLENESKLNSKLNEQIQIITEEKNLNRNILDSQSNLVILSDGKALIDANKSTFEIISKKETLENFLKEQKCICDYFIDIGDSNYIFSKYIKELTWLEYIAKNKNIKSKCAIEINSKIHHYKINVNPFFYYGKDIFIVTLDDITHEVEITEALKLEIKESKKKDLMLQQQSRLAALGEMIGNIAHQWRQPLSAITTAITGLKLKKEYDIMEDDDIEKTADDIIKSANFLSKTIDDFRNFFKKDKHIEDFYIDEVIHNTYDIIKASYQNNLIEIDFEMEHVWYRGYPTELSQVVLNILANAKEALVAHKDEDRYVHIKLKTLIDCVQISIHDNAGGVDEEIMEKIFDPYFTTKHKSMGTGLGLYMSTQIVKGSFKGNLYVQNEDLSFNGKSFRGANFIVELPIQKKDEENNEQNI